MQNNLDETAFVLPQSGSWGKAAERERERGKAEMGSLCGFHLQLINFRD